MVVFEQNAPLIAFLQSFLTQNKSIGFVPTMGALHQGHLSLMANSLEENDCTVVSIFVNPTQFNNPEDLKRYPRNIAADIEKIKTISDRIILFTPDVTAIYGTNVQSEKHDFDGLEHQMEGKFRPGHFDGVGTIVQRLFEIVSPTRAYFGEKDFQQLQIIKKLVVKKNLKVTIKECPIFREKNGLAMSSRNERLTAEERNEASKIYKILQQAKILFEKNSAKKVSFWVEKSFLNDLVFSLEYFQIAEVSGLLPCIKKNKNKKYRAFIAVNVNNIRLIDTISLN